ncbi:hypothetical protein ACFO1B_34685 [Dactylosporangium siamense]|uniref:TIGR04222 domain-containing membrane protein n=1 Tax=Dactylosporangium siamense TaxID=685454 RepID=A0A919PJP9_9ACTN|nr:hypothetical protein [Dactylosporangium siamense]GIG44732.1 hypothetical protein Dsi01nite_027730 [Dactylosporangium siamense]
MSKLELAGVITAGYAALFVVLNILAWISDSVKRRRSIAPPPPPPLPAGVEIDPYHALAVRSGGPGGMDQAALASLLHDGLITIDADGLLAPSGETGPEPTHPVPAAWLECLHRAERPVAVSELRDDPELWQRHTAFLQQQDARVAEWNTKAPTGGFGCASIAAAAVVTIVDTVLLAPSVPDSFYGPTAFEQIVGFVLLAILLPPFLISMCAAIVMTTYPGSPSPLDAYCARLPPHPAVAALTAEEERLLAG